MESKILFIIEDDELFDRVKNIIEHQKFIFDKCVGKNNALNIVRKNEYDLILIHEKFILSHGIKIIRQLAFNSYMDNIPIILVLDNSNIKDFEQLFSIGVSDFVKMDFNDDEIIIKIDALLENKNKISSLEQSLIISASLIDNLESHLIDIDKLKEQIESQNHKLEEEIQKKHEIYAGNLHDLKAPFSSLLGNTQLLLEGYLGELTEEQIKSIKVIEQSGRKLLELIENYLDNSQFEAGKVDLYLNKVDVSFLIELAIKDLLILIENKELTLVTDVKPPLPKVQVDIDKVIRVIHNIVVNAIKNTGAGGKICIKAVNDIDNYVTVTICDTGAGISKENQKTIFDKYEQGGRNVSGSGLGLAICKNIIEELHYGKIWVESEPGKGSDFHFTLPVDFRSMEAEQVE